MEMFDTLCDTMAIPVVALPGKRSLTKGAYVTAFVNRYFAAESIETKTSIIDRILGTKAEDNMLPADFLDILDCLEKTDTAEYKDLKKVAELAQKFRGNTVGFRNSTPPIVKALVPAGVVVCRMSGIRCYEASHRLFQPKRWYARRWGGPIAVRTEVDALSQVLTLIWDIDQNYNPEHDSSLRPSRDKIIDVVNQLQQGIVDVPAADVPAARGRGRGRGIAVPKPAAVPAARGRAGRRARGRGGR